MPAALDELSQSASGYVKAAETGDITVGEQVSETERQRFAEFLASLRERGRSPATSAAYVSDWKAVALWYAAVNSEPFDFARLVGREVAEFKAHSLARGHAPATVNRRLGFLMVYARWAVRAGAISAQILQAIETMSRVRSQQLAPRSLPRPELRRLLKEIDLRARARDSALLYLMLFTGLRLGEVAHLALEDLHFSERKGSLVVQSRWAKGGKQRRIPIPAAARVRVQAYLAERGEAPGPLFVGQRGPLGRKGIAAVVNRYARFAGLKISAHTLRHCFAYRYLEASEKDLVGLAALLGHTNLNTTMVYTRRRPEDLELAMEDLDFT